MITDFHVQIVRKQYVNNKCHALNISNTCFTDSPNTFSQLGESFQFAVNGTSKLAPASKIFSPFPLLVKKATQSITH